MALLVHVKKDGKLLVNGAVLENASGRTMSVLLRNEAIVLRGEEILPHAGAVTPATRLYYALQCAYLFPDDRAAYLAVAADLMDGFERAAPGARSIVEDLRSCLRAETLYAALKPGKTLIQYEYRALAAVCGELEAGPDRRAAGGAAIERTAAPFNGERRMARAAGCARP